MLPLCKGMLYSVLNPQFNCNTIAFKKSDISKLCSKYALDDIGQQIEY